MENFEMADVEFSRRASWATGLSHVAGADKTLTP